MNRAVLVRLLAIGVVVSASAACIGGAIGQTNPGIAAAGSSPRADLAISDEPAPAGIAGASKTPTDSQTIRAPGSATRINILDFCEPGSLNGKSDNTACIQAAVTATCTRRNGAGSPINGGGTIDMPPNTYTIDANVGVTIPCEGVLFRGGGWGNPNASNTGTEIKVIGAGSAPILRFASEVKGNARRYSYGGGVRDIGFVTRNSTSSIVQTGPMVAFEYCYHCQIDRVYSNGAFRFATNYAGIGNQISHSVITQVMPGGEGIEIYGSDSGCSKIAGCPTREDLFEIDNTVIDAALAKGLSNANCIHVRDFAATTWITNVACNQTKVGLYVDCPTSSNIAACPQFLSLYDFETEANDIAGNGANGAAISAFDFVDLECHDCIMYGYSVDNLVKLGYANQRGTPGASNAKFFGGKVERSEGSCIVAGIPGLQIIGMLIDNCGTRRGGMNYGVEAGPGLGSPNSGSIIIQSATFCYYLGSAPTSMGAILLEKGTDYNVIMGNVFRACSSGVTNNSGGSHNVIANNSGP